MDIGEPKRVIQVEPEPIRVPEEPVDPPTGPQTEPVPDREPERVPAR